MRRNDRINIVWSQKLEGRLGEDEHVHVWETVLLKLDSVNISRALSKDAVAVYFFGDFLFLKLEDPRDQVGRS